MRTWLWLCLFMLCVPSPVYSSQLAADAFAARVRCATQSTRANWIKARDLNKACLVQEPQNKSCQRCLWEAYINLGEFENAEATLQTMKPNDPLDHDFWGYWVVTKTFKRDYKSALAYSDLAGKAKNLTSDYYLFRGDILMHLGRYHDAAVAFGHRPGQKDLSWILSNGKRGAYRDAMDGVRQIREEISKAPVAIWLLSQVPFSRLQTDDIAYLARCCEAESTKRSQASACWHVVLQREPKNPVYVLPAAGWFLQSQQYALGESCLARLEPECASNDKYWALRSSLAMRLFKGKESELYLDKAIRLAPGKAEYYYSCSFHLVTRKLYGKAFAALDKAVALAPERIEYRQTRMELAKKHNFFDRVVADSKYLASRVPGKEKVRYLLETAIAQRHTADLRASLQTLQEAELIDPHNGKIDEMVKSIKEEMRACELPVN
jgi:tetratricopeptide (TPR) repeat protein